MSEANSTIHAIRRSPCGVRCACFACLLGELCLMSVNAFLSKSHGGDFVTGIELIRSIGAENRYLISNVVGRQAMRDAAEGLGCLQKTA